MKEKLTYEEKQERKLQKRKDKLLSITPDHDIRYKAPMGVTGLRIFGWSCMVLMFFSTGLSLLSKSKMIPDATIPVMILEIISSLSIPIVLMARFGTIFNNQKGYKDTTILFGIIAGLIYAVYLFVYMRYAVTLLSTFAGGAYWEAFGALNVWLCALFGKRISFNIFIDMFLCSFFVLCLNYSKPGMSKHKKVIIRSCAVIPFVYVIAAFVYKIIFGLGLVPIHALVIPLLPTLSPMTFLTFAVIALVLNNQKKLYIRYGGTEEGYEQYVKTNAHAFNFSRVAAASFAVCGLVQLFIVILLICFDPVTDYDLLGLIEYTGLQNCLALFVAAPIMLLFRYTKKPGGLIWSIMVPVVAMVIIALFLFECGFNILTYYVALLAAALQGG